MKKNIGYVTLAIKTMIVGLLGMGLNGIEGEYKEIDIPSGNEYTSIVCEVKTNAEYGFIEDEYLPCENVNDYTDFPLLDKETVNVGDMVHVTFYHDDVYAVDKIDGYKMMIKKQAD